MATLHWWLTYPSGYPALVATLPWWLPCSSGYKAPVATHPGCYPAPVATVPFWLHFLEIKLPQTHALPCPALPCPGGYIFWWTTTLVTSLHKSLPCPGGYLVLVARHPGG